MKPMNLLDMEEVFEFCLKQWEDPKDLKRFWENSVFKDNPDILQGMREACLFLPMLLYKISHYVEFEEQPQEEP